MKKKLTLILVLVFLGFLTLKAQNLLSNGGFENDFTGWTNLANGGSVATFSIETANVNEGTKAMKAIISTLGPNAWSVESDHVGWPSVQGKEYKFTFYARAAISGTKMRVVQQKTLYAASDFILTTTWQKFEWTFVAQESNQQLKFHWFALGTIYLDDLSITESVVSTGTTDGFAINPNVKFQTMEGFGGAIAFYDNWVTGHPNKEEIYQLIFKDLGLDWFRIRNTYRYETTFAPLASEFVQKANTYTEDSVRVLMCSWSPPATLKSNNNTNNGTLKKENGAFVYTAFADYWKQALVAYDKAGIRPKMISIQNEPDFLTDGWETCKFLETETADFPGYDKAFDAVYNQIKTLPNAPKLIGAEPLGIGYGNFTKYTDPIKNRNYLTGYAYHLYHGGDPNLPDSYKQDLNNIRQNYGDRPNYMTEYEHFDAGWFKNAWLVNNVLTEASASIYFYWDLVWPDHGLIDIDNPWDQSQWGNAKGYTVNPQFYAFKHFSKHIKPGYKRISGVNSHSAIRSSAFLSPDGNEMVVILLNTFDKAITSKIAPAGFTVNSSVIYQSVQGNYYQNKGSLAANSEIVLPVNSLTTVVLKKGSGPVNVAPTASITAPLNGASFNTGTTITISATASDTDGTISKVEFFAGSTKIGEDLTAPYSFAWTGATAATYSLTAVATDNLGAKGTSAAVSITVKSPTNQSPVTAITAPIANASFNVGSTITIAATASDADGTVAKVEFFAGSTKIGEDLTAPYSFAWTGAAVGTHSLTTVSTDNLGAKGTSAAVSITVRSIANQLPVVAITAPIANASFNVGSAIAISATASDADGTIAKVEFFAGSTKLGEDITAPYNFAWTNAAVGTYSLTAVATDNIGGKSTSTAISITVKTLGDTNCKFGTPRATALPTVNASYNKVYVLGTGGPNLNNISNFTVNWNLSMNGLWQLSFNTNNGVPTWWLDIRTVATARFNQVQPDITFTNSGFPGLDGQYWVTLDGSNFAMVSKTGGFTIYFSNASTAPVCTTAKARLSLEDTNLNNVAVYPNPSQGTFNIEIAKPEEVIRLHITDNLGRTVKNFLHQEITPNIEFRNNLGRGVYILKVHTLKGNEAIILIKH